MDFDIICWDVPHFGLKAFRMYDLGFIGLSLHLSTVVLRVFSVVS